MWGYQSEEHVLTEKVTAACQTFWSIRQKNPGLYLHARKALEIDLHEIEDRLKCPVISKKEKMHLERRMWVLKGVLNVGLNMDLLNDISIQHASKRSVPVGYNLVRLSTSI